MSSFSTAGISVREKAGRRARRGFRPQAARPFAQNGSACSGFTLIEIMIVVLIIGILLAIAVPNFVKARESARTKSCVSNLQQIQSSKQQWAMDNRKAGTAVPTAADLFGPTAYISGATTGPKCPSGTANYTLTAVDIDQTCPNVATNSTHTL